MPHSMAFEGVSHAGTPGRSVICTNSLSRGRGGEVNADDLRAFVLF